jgi:hypothetical protein
MTSDLRTLDELATDAQVAVSKAAVLIEDRVSRDVRMPRCKSSRRASAARIMASKTGASKGRMTMRMARPIRMNERWTATRRRC